VLPKQLGVPELWWQKAQTAALPSSVFWCVGEVEFLHVVPAGCGALVWQSWQEVPEVPPKKFVPVPWQIWQYKNPVVAPGASFAAFPCGWAAGGVATQALSTGCGTGVAWHSVLLKQSGVPGLAFRWHWAHTGAFDGSVSVWVYGAPRQGAGACGGP